MSNWLLMHIVLLKLGDPAGAEPLARRTLALAPPSLRPVARSGLLESLRLLGRSAEAEALLPDLLADLNSSTVLCSPELVTTAVVMLSLTNRDQQAAELIHSLGPTLRASPVVWALLARALADAYHAVALGDEDRAVAVLREVAGSGLIRSPAVLQVSAAALPLIYVLVPRVREHWDAAAPPGCFADTLRVVQALVDVRENGTPARVRALPLTTRRIAGAQLPVSWATELAVALIAAGRADGRELLDELGTRTRATLRRLTGSPAADIAGTARSLIRNIPAMPAYRLRLRVLGPLRLERDGSPVVAPELGRMRVRHLLGFLLVHRRTTRAAITAELWPDLDERSAGRNLRVTLAYLQNLLEPDRAEQEPPYFVRSTGSMLELITDECLLVDADEFDRIVEAASALERQGAPSAALAAYRRAIALWGGDFLADVTEGASLELERDRVRGQFVTIAIRAGHLLLAHGDVDAALVLGKRVLGVAEWSETAYQLLIAAYLSAGDLANAMTLLRRCHAMLRELGVNPHQRTQALAQQLREQQHGRPARPGAYHSPPVRRPAEPRRHRRAEPPVRTAVPPAVRRPGVRAGGRRRTSARRTRSPHTSR
nr:hypothetical protein GCM10020092_052600 [Actinoplanes digitatis]